MSLQKQTKPIALYGGIDTRTDPKYVAAPLMLQAQNVRFYGIASAQKRYGQTALPQNVGVSGQKITAGKALGSFNNELLLFDGTALYSYAQAAGTWVNRGALTEVLVSPMPVVRSSGSVLGISTALAGTAEVYAWEDSRGGVYYAVRDPLSGAFTTPATRIDAYGSSPQVVVTPTYTYIFFAIGSLIWVITLNTVNPYLGILSRQLLSTSGTAGVAFAVAASATLSTILLVFQDSSSSTFHVQLRDFLLNVLQNTTFTYAATATQHIAAAFSTDGSRALALVTTTAAVKPVLINTSTGATSTALSAYATTAALKAGAVGLNASTIQINWDDQPANNQPVLNQAVVTFSASTTATLGATSAVQGLRLVSQPALSGTMPYLIASSALTNLAGATSQQISFFLVGGSSPTILQRFFDGTAYFGGTVTPALAVNSAGQLFVGLAQRTALRVDATGSIYSQTGITACYFTFPSASQVRVIPFQNTALINCGATWTYDGAQLVESGFWEFPDGITTAVLPTNGNLNAGTYIYCYTYEWTDAAGNTHYSAPSYPVTVSTTLGCRVQHTIPYTALTRRSDAVIGVYRTATAPGSSATVDTGLGPWYKVATVANVTTGAAAVTYMDGAADATLTGQQFLYAPPDGSGELDNEAPPPFSYIVATKSRLFGIAQDDPMAIWYSKPMAYGRPAEWSPFFVKRIEADGGAVTALSAIDTTAIIFKERKIQYISGDGPNAAGQNDFGQPQLISTTSGCVSASSILATSDGVYFQSDVGLAALGRSLAVDSSFGMPVQGLLANLTLTGAQAISAQNQLRWTSSQGTCLVYDYIVKRWSTYTNYDAVAYIRWQKLGTRLRSTGQVLYEDTSTYLDAGTPVSLLLETAWNKTADLAQGFGAVWYAQVLGDYASSHTLNVEIAYDYVDAPMQTATWNATSYGNYGMFGSAPTYGADPVYGANVALPYTSRYQPRIALARQVCEAIKFKIYDSGISGQSCTLNEIAIEFGVIGGLNRVPASQQVQ